MAGVGSPRPLQVARAPAAQPGNGVVRNQVAPAPLRGASVRPLHVAPAAQPGDDVVRNQVNIGQTPGVQQGAGGYPNGVPAGVMAPAAVSRGARVVQAAGVIAPQPLAGPAARAQAALGDRAKFQAKLEHVLERPKELEERVRMRFRKLARKKPGHTDLVMEFDDIEALVKMLAAQLQVDPSVFGDAGQMFWRFDFSGDGMLDEDEATKLCLCMLRQYRDATRPPQPGCMKLGGHIPFRNVEEKYAVSKKLGEGGQGAVYLAQEKGSGQSVVVKYYDKSSPNAPVEDITAEFELMMQLKHPRIAHYFEIFQDMANVYVVQEPYFGGDLTTAVWKASQAGVRVNESWMAIVMQQVLAGVAYLHSNAVMHCDLKEANVMIAGKEDWHAPQVVVIDFGLSNNFNSKSRAGGTPGYMPPEVWEYGLWTPKGDVFSLGVMFYSMRTGRSPFTEGCSSIEDVRVLTMKTKPEMQLGTPHMKELTMGMLEKSFHKRLAISTVMADPWFTNAAVTDEEVDEQVLQNVLQRSQTNDLQRALLADLASRQNLAELRELNNLFVMLDKDNDGTLSAEEVRTGLSGKWAAKDIEDLIRAIASNGQVSYEEFMGQVMAAKETDENQILAKMFTELDTEGKGFLNEQNISELLKRPAVARVLGNRDPAQLMREMDKDGNNEVSFEEFRFALQGRKHAPLTAQKHRDEQKPLEKGQQLQYYSTTYNSWVPCVVTDVDKKSGAVVVNVKPGYWFKGQELRRKLRLAGTGTSCSPVAGVGRQLFAQVLEDIRN
mmetsp:Transcript_65773/g.183208  ORF Transcript_65773/g.183208 Transcript_65773/m.183208 type:complete len:776 (+) Transcript_65773:72-2399(+)